MPERARLTNALAHAARPRQREYSIQDVALPGVRAPDPAGRGPLVGPALPP